MSPKKTAAEKTAATPKTAAPAPAAAGDAPILDLAILGDVLASADGDGRVVTWRVHGAALTALATLHDDAQKPITALAATDEGFVGAGASLVAWSVDGKELARAALPAVATNVVVRGDAVFVLAGGKLLSFALPELTPTGEIEHAKGVSCELDVDDARTRALVIRDEKHVELIDLAKKKSLADWTRKGSKVRAVSARFGDKGTVLSVMNGDSRLSRVKDLTGRITGEVIRLVRFSNGPIVLDRARKVAAIGGGGEDVEIVELDPPRTAFYLDPDITDAGEKSLASLERIPTFKELAPGFFARHGSAPAPPSPSTLTAMAVRDGGGVLAAGFVSGEIVVAETTSGAVVSTRRGALGEAREKARVPREDVITSFDDGNELWVLHKDGRLSIFDLVSHAMRRGPTLAEIGAVAGQYGTIALSADAITFLCRTRVIRWSREGGALLVNRELPEHKGAHLHDGAVLLLPVSSLGHEGFDIVSLDVVRGETKPVVHFVRDPSRFALGDDPTGWVRFGRTGAQPTLVIWAGSGATVARTYAFDVATGTLGRELPNRNDADGRFLATPDFSNPLRPGDAVSVTDMVTGEEILRCPYEPGDAGRIDTAAFDPDARTVAALVGDSRVAVWRPGARRLVLHGHRGVNRLWLRAQSLVAWDRSWMRLWDIGGA